MGENPKPQVGHSRMLLLGVRMGLSEDRKDDEAACKQNTRWAEDAGVGPGAHPGVGGGAFSQGTGPVAGGYPRRGPGQSRSLFPLTCGLGGRGTGEAAIGLLGLSEVQELPRLGLIFPFGA